MIDPTSNAALGDINRTSMKDSLTVITRLLKTTPLGKAKEGDPRCHRRVSPEYMSSQDMSATTSSDIGRTISAAEYNQIISVVHRHYIDAVDKGYPSIIAHDFHQDAILYGYTIEGTMHGGGGGGSVRNLVTYADDHDIVPLRRTRIDVVSITPSTAVVKVFLERDAAGMDYTDYHTLIKYDGEWCVIAKTFHSASS